MIRSIYVFSWPDHCHLAIWEDRRYSSSRMVFTVFGYPSLGCEMSRGLHSMRVVVCRAAFV